MSQRKKVTLHGREFVAEVTSVCSMTINLSPTVTVTGYGPTEETAHRDLVSKLTANEVISYDEPKGGRVIAVDVQQKL